MKEVDMYWQGKPELGFLECEISPDHRLARWAMGKWNRITYCHSFGHWVWVI